MKNRLSPAHFLAIAISLISISGSFAADTNGSPEQLPVPGAGTETSPARQPVTAVAPSTRLPYGVDDIIKLSRAKVSEEVILTYVQNSGTIYNLSPTDIVYMRDQGVSDRVVNSMLDQRKKSGETVAPAPSQQQPISADVNGTGSAPAYAQAAPQVQPAPSTVYTIPYQSSSYLYNGYPSSYYYYPPYYGGYYRPYGYFAPSFSFRFGYGWGGGYHHHHH